MEPSRNGPVREAGVISGPKTGILFVEQRSGLATREMQGAEAIHRLPVRAALIKEL